MCRLLVEDRFGTESRNTVAMIIKIEYLILKKINTSGSKPVLWPYSPY